MEKQKKNKKYQMLIQKIEEQIDTEADKWDIKEKHNLSKL